MLGIGRLARKKMQRQSVVLSSEAVITPFFIFIDRLTPLLVTSDSGGRRNRDARLTTRTVA
eukprot:2853103-Lingulodinium_polyedra.AAC.1